ncbi:nickel-responsive transcriptional regulator NikR [Thiothrix nivea]|uniref:Putative nickel-responsive regulator n=1 Tax=Thiothrix nivea (strain ATCC 35100 / DSM 5205 / JP2) TaxID=870187 RepID=A0A656HH00_THINJ|nr:nickel-responsive transcriptional regulator NikR [Thiothrix nivea]EIJ35482.1 transcriptional regulator, CopG family [Thiothrix nivea DSM 5205]
MERFTVSLDDGLAQQFGEFMAQHGYNNRSEAVRDLIRSRLEQERLQQPVAEGYCVGTLTYVYNHHERELASRVTQSHHNHHDLTVAMQHVHLDHDNCLETVILRGPVQSVQAFADQVISSPGIRHGRLHLIPVDAEPASHTHGKAPYAPQFQHLHFRPIT